MRKQLHPGARWMFRVQYFWAVIFLFVFLGFFIIPLSITSNIETGSNYIFKMMAYTLVSLTIIFAIWGEIWTRMAYNRWFYEFTDTNLKQERGVIWKTYSNVPYERIQNVDIRRGIIARMLGFSTIMIQTAGYSGAPQGAGHNVEGYIPAVNIQEAERIRDFIMKKTTGKKQGL